MLSRQVSAWSQSRRWWSGRGGLGARHVAHVAHLKQEGLGRLRVWRRGRGPRLEQEGAFAFGGLSLSLLLMLCMYEASKECAHVARPCVALVAHVHMAHARVAHMYIAYMYRLARWVALSYPPLPPCATAVCAAVLLPACLPACLSLDARQSLYARLHACHNVSTHTHTHTRTHTHIYIYIMHTYIHTLTLRARAGRRVSRPRGTGSVGDSVGYRARSWQTEA